MTSAVPVSKSVRTSFTFAGESALETNSSGSSENGTISIFSPRNSLTIIRTLAPLAPTQAPTGSTFGSFDQTAIFVRCPGSLAHDRISTIPSAISGTSSSKRRLIKPGCVLLTTIWGPFAVFRTSTMYAFILVLLSGRSLGTCSARGNNASTRPKSSSVYRLSLC